MIVIQDDSTRYNSNTYLVPTTRSLARYHILYISISTLTTPYPRPHRGRPPASPLTEPCAHPAAAAGNNGPRRQQPATK